MKKLITSIFLMSICFTSFSQEGGLSLKNLNEIKKGYKDTQSEKALRNAMTHIDINKLAVNQSNENTKHDTYFSNKVESKGITDQQSSGRCWLFTGLNVLRAEAIAKHDLGDFQFSQNYNFFWDQLEKSNLFLQGIIDTKELEMTDRKVEWLFRNALGDGGQFTGVSDLITKYGVVPTEVMPETYSSNNTNRMNMLLKLKLKEFALELRMIAAMQGKSPALGEGYAPDVPAGMQRVAVKPMNDKELASTLQTRKMDMLSIVYKFLVLNLGEPPTNFTWTRFNSQGEIVNTKEYTPQSFYQEYCGQNLKENYVMLMNDPSRDFYKVYEIEYDRHVYDGENWLYINLPIEDIKQAAITSIKDSTMMYFSCDVGKFYDRENGFLDINNYDYESLMGSSFGMNKRERVMTGASGSSHAMTLMAVDLDEKGQPKKWMVENSWGMSGYKGHLIMTDKWFDEYMFRVVVDKKYVSKDILKLLKQKPTMLPPWDPMFAPENNCNIQ